MSTPNLTTLDNLVGEADAILALLKRIRFTDCYYELGSVRVERTLAAAKRRVERRVTKLCNALEEACRDRVA